ncbi:hypothetical protein ACPCK9_25115 [Streptomyces koyangensis]|uniref:hypothetical protein n=1 Tax=Streptomyces koyangensis TaxID=188770 RepID=UPI003C2DDB86
MITADGSIGDLDSLVRSKNIKGHATAHMVETNGQGVFFSRGRGAYGVELGQLLTWFLLYKRGKSELLAELSLPVKINGRFVDEWHTRIPLALPPMDTAGFDISLDDGQGPEVLVELLGDNWLVRGRNNGSRETCSSRRG